MGFFMPTAKQIRKRMSRNFFHLFAHQSVKLLATSALAPRSDARGAARPQCAGSATLERGIPGGIHRGTRGDASTTRCENCYSATTLYRAEEAPSISTAMDSSPSEGMPEATASNCAPTVRAREIV